MFTDMVGSTASAQANESQALQLRAEQERLVRPLFAAHQGREVKSMGDGFLAEFDSALKAVQCAIDIQHHVHERNSRQGVVPIQLRIGVHLGDVEQLENDIFGDAVNIASRLEPLAPPGGVCISGEVVSQIRNKIPNHLEKLPPTALKGVRVPIDVYRVVLPWQGDATEGPSAASKGLRIVVLPFMNLSPNPSDAYFASGITEELISSVSRIRELSVISRTSAMRYRGGSKPLKEIGSELRVGYALEGSVRKSGDTVRISAQLIDVEDDRHLWSESYDRKLEDVFAVQSDVAQQVAKALKFTLVAGARDEIKRASPRNTDAYLLYLRGRSLMPLGHRGLAEAIRILELSIEKDPDYAPAYAALAECHTYSAGESETESEGLPKATRYARKAVELDPGLSEAHASLGILTIQRDLDWRAAEPELRKALELNSSNPSAHLWMGTCFMVSGRTEDALAEVRAAEQLDPLSPFVKWFVGYTLVGSRQYGEAKQKCIESLNLDHLQVYPHAILSVIHRFTSDLEAAISEGRAAIELEPDSQFGWEVLGAAYGFAGRRDEARKALVEIENLAARGFINFCSRALVELSLGNRDEALLLLERADEVNDAGLILRFGLGVLDALSSEPRFIRIAEKRGWKLRSNTS
jgi:adenylate cyclase